MVFKFGVVILGAVVVFFPTALSSSIESSFTECGRTTPRLQPMVVGGTTALRGELPWHAGIYRRVSRPFKLICGGSIISVKVVLSAAHCFWDLERNVAYPATHYAIAAGKIYRPWSEWEASAHYSFVLQVVIPNSFRGEDRNYADDIALAVLSWPFEFKPYLRPVCLDFNSTFEEAQLRNGNLGKIAGWGLVSDSGNESALLRTTELPYMDISECLRRTPSSYWEVLTNDKFCAGYDTGLTALCKGDSGGGLVFPRTEPGGITRYFLRGVVSTSPSSATKCNALAVTSFTRVSRYGAFIRQVVPGEHQSWQSPTPTNPCILPPHPKHGSYKVGGSPDALPGSSVHAAMLNVTCDPPYQLNGVGSLFCIDGVWQAPMPTCSEDPLQDCGKVTPEYEPLIVNGTQVHAGQIPWHAGLYLKETGGIHKQLCGATVVSRDLVVTAAHCVWDHSKSASKPASEFSVAAGKLYSAWSREEHSAQKSDVSSIAVPRRFLGQVTNFVQDIALLKLTTNLVFKPYLRPVCLDFDNTLEKEQLKNGNKGIIAGWGLTEANGKLSETLQKAEFPYKDYQTCFAETPPDFREYYTQDKICAGSKGTAVCLGDSGGGLAFPSTKFGVTRYYLRGVASTGPRSDDKCNVDANTYYTKISSYKNLFDDYWKERQ